MKNNTKLSIVISAFNEEKNIEGCLVSVKKLVDEIIVVDNDSTDKTSDIAKKYTKKVYQQKNNPQEIDLQKNFGFTKATGDWILSLDADERVTSELSEEIRAHIESTLPIDGYWIPRKNIIFGKWIKSDMWWPDFQLRLFKKGKGKFEKNSVHKALTVEGETQKLENPFLHENYQTISQYIEKLNNYTDIEAENLSKDYQFNFLDAIRFPINDFVKTFFLQKGYRDGLHGLVLSALQAFYMEVVFAKLWEKKKFVEVEGADFTNGVKREFKNTKNKIKYWVTTSAIEETSSPIKKAILRTARKIISSKVDL